MRLFRLMPKLRQRSRRGRCKNSDKEGFVVLVMAMTVFMDSSSLLFHEPSLAGFFPGFQLKLDWLV